MAQPPPTETPSSGNGAPDLARMNQEIDELVAGRGSRRPDELIPDVEAVMRRHGVSGPSRNGILQWIEESLAKADTTPREQ